VKENEGYLRTTVWHLDKNLFLMPEMKSDNEKKNEEKHVIQMVYKKRNQFRGFVEELDFAGAPKPWFKPMFSTSNFSEIFSKKKRLN
jgi:hypothetical protein